MSRKEHLTKVQCLRQLTFKGKVLIICNKVLHVFQYTAQTYPSCHHLQGHYQDSVFPYLGLNNGQSEVDCYVQGTKQEWERSSRYFHAAAGLFFGCDSVCRTLTKKSSSVGPVGPCLTSSSCLPEGCLSGTSGTSLCLTTGTPPGSLMMLCGL